MLKVTWKSLLARKLRLIMSTFAIVLGVAFVAGSFIFTDTLGRSFTAIFASSVGDVVVRPVGPTTGDGSLTTKTVPGSLVDRLSGAPGAARADGNVSSFGVYVIDQDNKLVGGNGPPGIALNLTGAPAGHGITGMAITQGRAPTKAGEIAMDAQTAKRAQYQIGSTVHLVSASQRALLTPTLVGLASFPDGGSTNGATITIFDTHTAQRLFENGKNRFTDAWVTAKPGVSQGELRDQVARLLPKGYQAVTGDRAAQQSASQLLKSISFINKFLLIFAGISLVVGSFLIVNTFSILVAQRSKELALLRALGASRRQVTRSVLFEAFVLGLVGATIGLGLGVLLAMGIRALFATFGLDLTGAPLIFQPRTFVAAYVVGIAVTTVAAYLPARRSAQIAPVAALRDDVAMPESTLRRRLLAGIFLVVGGLTLMLLGLYSSVPQPGYWVGGGILAALIGVAAASPVLSKPFLLVASGFYRRTMGMVGRLAGQNSLRNPRRTAATASALMIGLALVATMSVVGTSSKASIDHLISGYFQGDLVVSNVVGSGFSPSIADKIATTSGVASVARLRYDRATYRGSDTGINGVDPASIGHSLSVPMVSGSAADLSDGSVLVSQKRAIKDHLGIGDTVRFTMPTGKKTYQVAGIMQDNSPVLFYPFTTTLTTLHRAGFQAQDNFLIVTTSRGTRPAALKRVLDEQTKALPTVTVKDQAGYAAEQRGQFNQLLFLIYALLALALVIAVLGIVNTLALSVIERTREIGLLRAIGLSRRQLRRMIRLEAVVIAVLGAILGVAMGVVFGVVLMVSLRSEGLDVIAVPYVQLAILVIASVGFGILAAALPARRAGRLDVLTAIASE